MYSDTKTAEEISHALGRRPDDAFDKGSVPRRAAGRGGARPAPTPRRHTMWALHVADDGPDAGEQTGVSALRRLADVLIPLARALSELRDDGAETVVWWNGDSDSEQGGFVLPADLMRDLAGLGCDLVGNVWLATQDEEAE